MNRLLGVLCIFATLASAPLALAQSFYTWTGAGGNDLWSNGGNWTGGAPVSGDSTWLIFRGTKPFFAPADNDIADPFQLNILSFGPLTGEFYTEGGTLDFVPNGIFGAGIEHLSGFTAGINNNVNASAALQISGTGSILRFGGLFTTGTSGAVNISRGVGTLTAFDGGLVNQGNIYVNGGNVDLWNSLTNTGGLYVYAGSTLRFAANSFYNFDAGSLLVGDGGSRIAFEGGQSNFNVSGTALVSAGTVAINGAALDGAGDFTLDVSGGFFDWRGGAISGTSGQSAVILLNTGILEGPASRQIGRALTLSGGALTWNGGDLALVSGGSLRIVGNTITATGLAGNITASGTGNTVEFVNGLLNKTSGTSVIEIQAAVSTDTNSSISTSAGGIRFANSGSYASVLSASAGGFMEFAGGVHNLENGASLSGSGSSYFRIASGTLNINSSSVGLNSPLILEAGATLGGSAFSYTLGGERFQWNGGTITGPASSQVTISAPTVISGTATKTIDQRAVMLFSGTWAGGDVELTNGGRLTVGGLTVTSDNTISRTGTSGALIVDSVLIKAASGGTTTIAAPIQVNAGGNVQAASGRILLTGGGTSVGVFSATSNGIVEFGGGDYAMNGFLPLAGGIGSTAAQFVISGGSVNINSTSASLNGNAKLSLLTGGTLGGSAVSYTISGTSFQWSGGVITGPASSQASVFAPTVISGTATKTIDQRTILLSSGTWAGGDIELTNGGRLNVGGLTVTSDNTISRTGTSGALIVDSVLIKAASGGTTTIAAPIQVNAGGNVQAASGRILLTGGGTSVGVFSATSNGIVEFGGGDYAMNGFLPLAGGIGSTAAQFVISGGSVNINSTSASLNGNAKLSLLAGGTLGGSAVSYTISGTSFQWSGGVITGPASSQASVFAPTVISGTATKTINQRTILLSSGTWAGGDIELTNGGRLNVGGLTVTSDNTISRTGTSGALIVDSVLIKAASGGTTTIAAPIQVNGGGNVQAASGRILLTGGGTSTGVFSATSNGIVEFGGGDYAMNGSLPLAGGIGSTAAQFIISGGSVNINSTSASLNGNAKLSLLAGGTLGGSAVSYTISGTSFQWSGGVITGPASSQASVFAPTVISGTATKTIDQRTILLSSGTWAGGNIALNNNGSLALGTMVVQSDRTITQTGTGGGISFQGTFTKNTTTGTTTIDSAFTNSSLIDVQTGVLRLTRTGTNSGQILVRSGGALDVAAELRGSGNTIVQAGGLLIGTGTIQGSVTVSGTLSPGNSPGTMTFGSSLLMDDDSTYLFELGALEDDQSGGVAGTDWDLLAFTGSAGLTFDTDSQLTLDFTGIADPNTFNSFWDGVTDRSWLIASLDSGSLSYANLSISNAEWETGTFSLTSDGNDLYLQFTAVPEPSAGALLALGLGILLRRKRLVRR